MGKLGVAPAPAPLVAEAPPPAYEPQLLRLSEVMGALAYLQTVCDAPGGAAPVTSASSGAASSDAALDTARDKAWRDRMEALMTAEEAGPSRREKLAGAFNRGWQGYQYSYRICTPNAQLARSRFLEEGASLAHDISTRFRAN
jgi:predicted secreted protein